MKKLIELWAEKKALCIGVIAGAVIVIGGGITAAVIIGSNHAGKETAVASEETSGHSKETDKNKKNNQTTQTTQSVTERSTEVTESATEEVTDESKEDNTEEKENVKEVAADNDNTGTDKSDNVQSENTDSNNASGNESSDNGGNSNSNNGNNSTPEPVKPAEPVTQAPVVIHGKDGVILDELTMYRKKGAEPVPKILGENSNVTEDSAIPLIQSNCETSSAFKDGIIFNKSTEKEIINRYGTPLIIRTNDDYIQYIYKYTNEVNDENKAVYIKYMISDGKLIQISISGINF